MIAHNLDLAQGQILDLVRSMQTFDASLVTVMSSLSTLQETMLSLHTQVAKVREDYNDHSTVLKELGEHILVHQNALEGIAKYLGLAPQV